MIRGPAFELDGVINDPAAMDRFWSKVDRKGPGECWPWTAFRNRQGYGHFKYAGRMFRAHRVSFAAAYGPIPEGLCVDHVCFNPSCVNPSHLQLLTLSENSRRQKSALKGFCVNGHPRTVENTFTKPNGRRGCRVCQRAAVRAYYARTVPPRVPKTHCVNGHPFDEKNTAIRPDGFRRCRACGTDYYYRKRASQRRTAA